MSSYTYPGVYVNEVPSTHLSINSAPTSVPVFACSPTEYPLLVKKVTVADAAPNDEDSRNTSADPASAPASYRFNSLVEVEATSLVKTEVIYVALRAYFENGGGYCYVVSTDQLITVVPLLPEVTLLVAAGCGIRTQAQALCNGQDKYIFGILDVAKEIDLSTSGGPGAANNGLDALMHTAVYYPWLKADWAGTTVVPPSAAVAGVYCSVDRDRGVWKAPANVQLQGGLLPAKSVSDSLQGGSTLHNAINMIRQVGERTAVVWGARTRADDARWVHIPVRRLFNSIEKDLRDALGQALFEPNNESTWETARTSVSNYLHRLWVAGALQGGTEAEAYFVQIGKGVTMTEDDIRGGRLIIKIGVAPARPAEFIVLSMTQDVMPG